MSTLSEIVRGTHFLVSYFGLAPLVNRRFLLAWDRGGPCAARDIFRAHCDRALKIAGADVTVEGEHHIPSEGSMRLRPGKLWVTYGEPIATVGLTEDAAEQFAARVRERVVALRR